MRALLLAAGILAAVPAIAQPAPPEIEALGQLLYQAQMREAATLLRAIRAERDLADARAKAVPAPAEPAK